MNTLFTSSTQVYLFSLQLPAPNRHIGLLFKIRLMLNIFNSLCKHKYKEKAQETFLLCCIISAGLDQVKVHVTEQTKGKVAYFHLYWIIYFSFLLWKTLTSSFFLNKKYNFCELVLCVQHLYFIITVHYSKYLLSVIWK